MAPSDSEAITPAEQEEDAKFEFCVQPASNAGSPDFAYEFDRSLSTESQTALGVKVSSLHSFLETPQLPDEHDCRIDTPLLDLQEQGYAMVSPGKTIMPREFKERPAVITENLMQISLKDDLPAENACPSSPLDARYLERSLSHPDMLSEDFADQDILESDEQEDIYLVWLLQWDAIDVPPILEGQPLAHGLLLKQVRFDPCVHIITSNLVQHGKELESASSGGTFSSLILDIGLDLASLPLLPDSPVQKSSPHFVKAKYHHLLPALPLTPLLYWAQTATKLRDQERMLTVRIDTLIAEMAELIDRCEESEKGLQATEAELQELQQKLAEEKELGFASIQEAALSMQENHLLGIALEETWKELDLMRGAWVDLQRQKKMKHETTCRAFQEQLRLPRAASLVTAPCSQAKNSSIVGLGDLADTLSRHSASDTHRTEDTQSTLQFVAMSLGLTVAMTACLLILLGDQSTVHRAGGTFVVMIRSFEPVVYRYSLLAKEEISEHWGELSQAVEHAKTAVVAPVQHAFAAWSRMMEYREEMWSLLTASSSRHSLLR
ncbi:hypothetical protein CPB97_009344 [Podila verticillata]|nr:hypothetical protein CPB97_009344 [Podila verticillata]